MKMDLNVDDPKAFWIVPDAINSHVLETNVRLLRQYIDEPPFFDDGESAAGLLRRKVVRRHSYSDSDRSLLSSSSESDSSTMHRKPKKKRKRTVVDDAELEARREKRRLKDLEKRALIKSAARIVDSDDDENADRKFFERERQLRERMARKAEDLFATGTHKFGRKGKRPVGVEEAMDLDSDYESVIDESARGTTPSVSLDVEKDDLTDSENGRLRRSKINKLRRAINISSDEE
jgi:replication fork protection complex subunit Tof1/Swi1